MTTYHEAQRQSEFLLRIAKAVETIATEMTRVEVTHAPASVMTELGEMSIEPERLDELVTEGLEISVAYELIDRALDDYHLALLNREYCGLAQEKLCEAVEEAFGRGGFEANRERLKPPRDELATVYIISPRKKDSPISYFDGWTETHWERFDYIECAIYTKPIADLDANERHFWLENNEIPDGWIHPSARGATS